MNRAALEAVRDALRQAQGPVSAFTVCVVLDALLAPAAGSAIRASIPYARAERDAGQAAQALENWSA